MMVWAAALLLTVIGWLWLVLWCNSLSPWQRDDAKDAMVVVGVPATIAFWSGVLLGQLW